MIFQLKASFNLSTKGFLFITLQLIFMSYMLHCDGKEKTGNGCDIMTVDTQKLVWYGMVW